MDRRLFFPGGPPSFRAPSFPSDFNPLSQNLAGTPHLPCQALQSCPSVAGPMREDPGLSQDDGPRAEFRGGTSPSGPPPPPDTLPRPLQPAPAPGSKGPALVEVFGGAALADPASRGTAGRTCPGATPGGARHGAAVSLAAWLTERLQAHASASSLACRVSDPAPKASPGPGRRPAAGRETVPRGSIPPAPCPLTAVAAPEAKVPPAPPSDLQTALGAISHDIRNPLTTIRVFVDLLPQRVNRPEFMERFQRIVPREIQRIEDLAGCLRRLGKGTGIGPAGASPCSSGPKGPVPDSAEGAHPQGIPEAISEGEAL